jgi:hypothetical protein
MLAKSQAHPAGTDPREIRGVDGFVLADIADLDRGRCVFRRLAAIWPVPLLCYICLKCRAFMEWRLNFVKAALTLFRGSCFRCFLNPFAKP